MARPALRVRPAQLADLPALLLLGGQLRDQLPIGGDGGRARAGASARLALEARYREALEDPDRHLVVVVDTAVGAADEPLAMALLIVAPSNALLDLPAVHMSHAIVSDRHRRRGAGRALVGAATAYAEERGVEQLVVSVHPGSRESNRFFARLGFAPLAVRRSAPVATVRRRLASDEAHPAEHVVRRRRRPLRVVRGAAVIPLGPSTQEEL